MPEKMLPNEILIGKHADGSYWDHLPRITEEEKFRKQTIQRFISHDAFYRMHKYKRPHSAVGTGYASSDGIRDSSVTAAEDTPKTATTEENWAGASMRPNEDRRWIEEYEMRATKFLSADNANCTGTPSNRSNLYNSKNASTRATASTTSCSSQLSFCHPRTWRPCSAGRSDLCNICRYSCRGVGIIGCRLCPAQMHANCLNESTEDFVCRDCRGELNASKERFDSRSEEAEHETRLHFCVTKVCARWRSRAAKKRKKKVEWAILFLQSMVRGK